MTRIERLKEAGIKVADDWICDLYEDYHIIDQDNAHWHLTFVNETNEDEAEVLLYFIGFGDEPQTKRYNMEDFHQLRREDCIFASIIYTEDEFWTRVRNGVIVTGQS